MSILLVKIYYHLIITNNRANKTFTYSPLGKTFDKQMKTIEDHGKKQVETLENLKPVEGSKAIKL